MRRAKPARAALEGELAGPASCGGDRDARGQREAGVRLIDALVGILGKPS